MPAATTTKEGARPMRSDRDNNENAFERKIEANVTEFANEAGRKVREYFGNANEQLGEVTGKVNQEIRDNPMRAALIALGAGFLMGLIMRR